MSAAKLERRIGLPGAILLSFNGVLGGAIFALPAALAADFGSFSPWIFPLVALGAMLIVVPFARSAGAFPESGGPAEYGRVFGRFVGFELGWVYYVARVSAFAANANVITAYLARWWAPADEGIARAAILLAVCAGLAAVNVAGVRRALAVLGGFTFFKALPLLLVALAALAVTVPWPTPGPPPELSQVEAGILIVFYAFIGFENVVVPAGETRRPERALPRAMFITIAATALLYFLVQLAFVSALPGGSAGNESAPLIDLGRFVAGDLGAVILTFTAIASLGGNLHSTMTSTSRVTYALADRGDLPRWFAAVHPRFETPHVSVLFFGVVALALALSGSFVWLAVVSTLARLFVYAFTIAALPRAPGRGSLNPVIYAVGLAGILLCVWGAFQASAESWSTFALLAAAGALLYLIAVRSTRR